MQGLAPLTLVLFKGQLSCLREDLTREWTEGEGRGGGRRGKGKEVRADLKNYSSQVELMQLSKWVFALGW